MRQIAIVTGTRAEYGILKPVIEKVLASEKLQLHLIVTGMHLVPEYGLTVREIEKDGFLITAKVEMLLASDTTSAMGKSLGIGITGLTQEFERIKPDVVIVLGDRIEAFAGAIAGLFCGAAVAHIHGGEVTQGGMDEYMRHAITKLSHIHFPATPLSRERILSFGENPDYIFYSGTPGLDAIHTFRDFSTQELSGIMGVVIPERFILAVQHPISTHPETAAREMTEILSVMEEFKIPVLLGYPNADAGSRDMIHVIKSYENQDWLTTFINVPREVFCNLLKRCLVLVGNSSSGMIDAPAYGVPVINIGERQEGRERGSNVIDAAPTRESIREALKKALSDQEFITQAKNTKNPYGDGHASERICKVLEEIDFTKAKAQKRFAPELI